MAEWFTADFNIDEAQFIFHLYILYSFLEKLYFYCFKITIENIDNEMSRC